MKALRRPNATSRSKKFRPVLAVIPARGGSKGIDRKNLRRVAGNTLIGHACGVAAWCPSISHIVITSDDEEMGQEGLRNGAQHFIHRPEELASDNATAAETWRHAWLQAETAFDQRFDLSVLLQPTSPTRTVEDVETAIHRIIDTGAGAAITISPVPKHYSPHKQLALTARGNLAPVVTGSVSNTQRQAIPDTYWLNGVCYAAQRDSFMRNAVVIPSDAVPVMIERPVANIDELSDLELAEHIMSRYPMTFPDQHPTQDDR